MKLKISAVALSLSALLFSGCYEDKGNYDYAPIEELQITLPDAVEAMANAENVKFEPTIVSSFTGKEISAV